MKRALLFVRNDRGEVILRALTHRGYAMDEPPATYCEYCGRLEGQSPRAGALVQGAFQFSRGEGWPT